MFKALVLIGLAFGVMLGLVSRKKAVQVIGAMIFMPLLLLTAWNVVATVWSDLTVWEQLAVVAGGGIALLAALLLGTTFGREVLASVVGAFIHDLLRSFFRRRP